MTLDNLILYLAPMPGSFPSVHLSNHPRFLSPHFYFLTDIPSSVLDLSEFVLLPCGPFLFIFFLLHTFHLTLPYTARPLESLLWSK